MTSEEPDSKLPDQPDSVTKNLRKLQEGDSAKRAEDELFGRYYKEVVNNAQRRVRQLRVLDASDVAVSVWDTVLRGLADGRQTCHDRKEFEELLGKVTYHKAVNLYNWVKRPTRHPADRLDDDEILNSNGLDESYRQVAELFYLEGQTVEQVAASLDLTRQVVEERLDHIRKWLKKHRYRPKSFASNDATQHVSTDERPLDMMLFEELILSLEDNLRETVLLKLEGLPNPQIATALNVTVRQIERRLKLLRQLLEAELSGPGE